MLPSEYQRVAGQRFFLIISGPDKAGKGWLGERLHKRLMSQYVILQKPMHLWDEHCTVREREDLQRVWLEAWERDMRSFLEMWLRQSAWGRFSRVIVDRHYPDEWAYSRVFKRDSYDDATYKSLDEAHGIRAMAKLLIVAERNEKLVAERWDGQYPIQRYWDLIDAYDAFRAWSHLRSMEVCTREENIVEKVANWVMS